MKQKVLNWLYLVVAVVICIGFASCGDEEEDVNDGGPTNNKTSILGTWKWSWDSSSYALVTFREDGSGVLTEYDSNDSYDNYGDKDYFDWVLNGEKLVIVWDDGDREVYNDVTVINNKLYWDWDEPGTVWYRQTSDQEDEDDKPSIVGTWKWSWDSNSYALVTFREDGSGVLTEYDSNDSYDNYGDKDYFDWVLNGEKLVIVWDDGDREVYNDVTVINNKLYWDWDEPGSVWYRQ